MIADLVIRGGTVVTAQGESRAAIAIQGGRIAALDRDDAMPESSAVIDANGLHVLPGVIDTHVHLRDPGKVEREDWISGTQAAAAAGVTTILEMPIAIPPVHTAAILRGRAAHVQPRSIVDFGLYAGASAENLDEIDGMAAAGAIAFKTFRTRAIAGREAEFAGICCPDAGQMLAVMERTARTGLLHVVHAEDQQILDVTERRARETGRHDGLVHALARPEVAETASVAQCLALARATGARLQIAHLSSADALTLVTRAREDGIRVTAETCPHYLMFTDETLRVWGPFAKCNPPLRSAETQERLWEGLRSGVIDVLGTDHSPFLLGEKAPHTDDVWAAPPGMPALEEFLPLMLTAVRRERLTLSDLVRLTSENPARLFGLWPGKGALVPGADADVVLVDMRLERVHDHHALYTKARDIALMYDGVRFHGAPVMTLVRGQVVMQQGGVIGRAGWGRWLTPQHG
jgi:allantoinase